MDCIIIPKINVRRLTKSDKSDIYSDLLLWPSLSHLQSEDRGTVEPKEFVTLAGSNGIDRIFQQSSSWVDFAFDEQVVHVFPNMISRSVPGYWEVNQKTAVWAKHFYQPNTLIYDLGASLGAASWGIAQLCQQYNPPIIAVEKSAAMVKKLQENLAISGFEHQITVQEADICEIAFQPCSIVVCNYCLQFVCPTQREALLQRIFHALLPGGVLLLAEKISMETPEEDYSIRQLHHEWKAEQGYTLNEIEQKSRSIANVMPVDKLSVHVERLKKLGFHSVVQWNQQFNFVALLAQKSRTSQ